MRNLQFLMDFSRLLKKTATENLVFYAVKMLLEANE